MASASWCWCCSGPGVCLAGMPRAGRRRSASSISSRSPSTSRSKTFRRPIRLPAPPRGPRCCRRRTSPVLRVPPGFRVNLFANVPSARWLALTPDGDVLCAASQQEKIVLLAGPGPRRRGRAPDRCSSIRPRAPTSRSAWHSPRTPFTSATRMPCSAIPMSAVAGDDGPTIRLGKPEKIASLPGKGYNQHWTRNVVVAPDGKKLYVSVGSASNASPEEPPRASVLQMNLDGSAAEGLRLRPAEPGRAGVPSADRRTLRHGQRTGRAGRRPAARLLHAASRGRVLRLAVRLPRPAEPRSPLAEGRPQPASRTGGADQDARRALPGALGRAGAGVLHRQGVSRKVPQGAFVAFRGSWNRSRGTGYKIVFIPFDAQGRPKGWYEDFVTGFLLDPAGPTSWGRPVGVLMLPDGSLLFTEEINGRIYRVAVRGQCSLRDRHPASRPVRAVRTRRPVLARISQCAVKRRVFPAGANPARQGSLQPEAVGAAVEVTKLSKPSMAGVA